MRSNRLVITLVCLVLCSIFLFILIRQGGRESDPINGKRMADDYTTGSIGALVPTLPSSAEKRLLDAIDGYGIADIHGLVYMSGNYSYLGIEGSFAVYWGSVFHYSYVLRKDPGEPSWSNAKVYKWSRGRISYENASGDRVEQDIVSLCDLIDLPDSVLSNMLFEVTDPSMAGVWTESELEEEREKGVRKGTRVPAKVNR